jgi:ankyrin repeat protein
MSRFIQLAFLTVAIGLLVMGCMIRLLLDNGVDANAKDDRGETPLKLTIGRSYSLQSEKRYNEVAELLRQHGGHP